MYVWVMRHSDIPTEYVTHNKDSILRREFFILISSAFSRHTKLHWNSLIVNIAERCTLYILCSSSCRQFRNATCSTCCSKRQMCNISISTSNIYIFIFHTLQPMHKSLRHFVDRINNYDNSCNDSFCSFCYNM